MMHRIASRYFGPPNTPHEVRRLRQSNLDACMKLGQPIVWRHQFNNRDLKDGYELAMVGKKYVIPIRTCPACFNRFRGSVRSDCKICFGTGFASVATVTNKWIDEDGQVTNQNLGDALRAPVWRGYGPAVLTWMVEPDAAVDVFQINDQGAIVQTQNAQGIAPWYPAMGDNDLIVNVDLRDGSPVVDSEGDRYQLKLVNPLSVRGWGRATANSAQHIAAQTFEMARLPDDHVRFGVMLDDPAEAEL